ncbi:MAG TPA: hypothetical protein VL201_01800, partial [Patescibacteria group bacterium]|nr:hypothetical protein [Patescibacteria group bacterium]
LPSTKAKVEVKQTNGSKVIYTIYDSGESKWSYGNLTLLAYKKDFYAVEIEKKSNLLKLYETTLNKEKNDLRKLFIQQAFNNELFIEKIKEIVADFHTASELRYRNKVSINDILIFKSNINNSLVKNDQKLDIKQIAGLEIKTELKQISKQNIYKTELLPASEKIKKKKYKKKPSKLSDSIKLLEEQNNDYYKMGNEQYDLAQKNKDKYIKEAIIHFKNAFSAWSHVKNKTDEFIRTTVSAAIELAGCYKKENNFSNAKKEYQRAISRAKSSKIFSEQEIKTLEEQYHVFLKIASLEKPLSEATPSQSILSLSGKSVRLPNQNPKEESKLTKEERQKIESAREAKRLAKLKQKEEEIKAALLAEEEKKALLAKKEEDERQAIILEEKRQEALLKQRAEDEKRKEEELKKERLESEKKRILTQVISGKKLKTLAKLANDLKKHCGVEVKVGGSLIMRLAALIFSDQKKKAITINDIDVFVKSDNANSHRYNFNENVIDEIETLSERLIKKHSFLHKNRDSLKSPYFANYIKQPNDGDAKNQALKVELTINYPKYNPKKNLIPLTKQYMRFSNEPSEEHLTIRIDKHNYLILEDRKDGFVEKCREGVFWLNRLPRPFEKNVTGYFDRLYGAYLKIAGILSICDITKKALSQEWQVSYFTRKLFAKINQKKYRNACFLEMTQLIRKERFQKEEYRQPIKSFCISILIHSLYRHELNDNLFAQNDEIIIHELAKFCKNQKIDEKAEEMLKQLLPLCKLPSDELSTRDINQLFKKNVWQVLNNMNPQQQSQDSLRYYDQFGMLRKKPYHYNMEQHKHVIFSLQKICP